MLNSIKPRNPDLSPEQIAMIESDDPCCGKKFNFSLCRLRHLAERQREVRGMRLEYEPCAYCPKIINAMKTCASPLIQEEEKEMTKEETKPEQPALCACGNRLTKNGHCMSCKAKKNKLGTKQHVKKQQPPEPAAEATGVGYKCPGCERPMLLENVLCPLCYLEKGAAEQQDGKPAEPACGCRFIGLQYRAHLLQTITRVVKGVGYSHDAGNLSQFQLFDFCPACGKRLNLQSFTVPTSFITTFREAD